VTDGPADLNSIVVDGQPLLLAETTGGRAVHLIPEAKELTSDAGRQATC
jgi:hypothetical protein